MLLAVLWHVDADRTVSIEVITARGNVDVVVLGEDHHSGVATAVWSLAAIAGSWNSRVTALDTREHRRPCPVTALSFIVASSGAGIWEIRASFVTAAICIHANSKKS